MLIGYRVTPSFQPSSYPRPRQVKFHRAQKLGSAVHSFFERVIFVIGSVGGRRSRLCSQKRGPLYRANRSAPETVSRLMFSYSMLPWCQSCKQIVHF